MPAETRFQRAVHDTPGLRENKLRWTIQSVVGAVCAGVVLRVIGSPTAAFDQILAYVGVVIRGVVIINLLEFLWHYSEAPYVMLREAISPNAIRLIGRPFTRRARAKA
jgi:hypothetical protein